jgi:hypothetical protein
VKKKMASLLGAAVGPALGCGGSILAAALLSAALGTPFFWWQALASSDPIQRAFAEWWTAGTLLLVAVLYLFKMSSGAWRKWPKFERDVWHAAYLGCGMVSVGILVAWVSILLWGIQTGSFALADEYANARSNADKGDLEDQLAQNKRHLLDVEAAVVSVSRSEVPLKNLFDSGWLFSWDQVFIDPEVTIKVHYSPPAYSTYAAIPESGALYVRHRESTQEFSIDANAAAKLEANDGTVELILESLRKRRTELNAKIESLTGVAKETRPENRLGPIEFLYSSVLYVFDSSLAVVIPVSNAAKFLHLILSFARWIFFGILVSSLLPVKR